MIPFETTATCDELQNPDVIVTGCIECVTLDVHRLLISPIASPSYWMLQQESGLILTESFETTLRKV